MTTPVERLNLAPTLTRPLRLWNPLDYLRLLYWCFFFPQAIRWYVETFADPAYHEVAGRELLAALRHDPVQRSLLLQALLCLLLGGGGLPWLLYTTGISINWAGVAIVVAIVVPVLVLGSVAVGTAGVVATSVAGSTVAGVVAGVVVDGATDDVTVGLALAVTIGLVFGVASSVAVAVEGGVAGGAVGSVAVGVAYGLAAFGIAGSLILSVTSGVIGSITFGVAVGSAIAIAIGRVLDWLVGWLPASAWRCWGAGGRMVWLPLPGLKRHLILQLQVNWKLGVSNLNEFLRYTLQFISVVEALNAALYLAPPTSLLPHVAYLTNHIWDWDLLRHGSVDLRQKLIRAGFQTKLFFPIYIRRLDSWLQVHYPTELRIDTPARAACAGFWLWYDEDPAAAVEAFAQVKDLPHGPEIYQTALALQAGLDVQAFAEIETWLDSVAWLDVLPDPELRPGTLAALRTLRAVAGNARRAHQAHAPLTRSLALNQANAALTRLLDSGAESCPQPEWPLLRRIAGQWRDLLTLGGGELSAELLRQPVPNPYQGYSGLPLSGPSFVGRSRIFRQIETLWAGGQLSPPLVLFGHRRMGKSSILRQLAAVLPQHNLLVYLDMQDSGFVEHTGELLFDLAQAVQQAAAAAGLAAGPPPDPAGYANLGPARQRLNALWQRLDAALPLEQRLILAIDEFEVIQDGIDAGRIEAGVLEYLRAINQRYIWLDLIFAGLHKLDELGRDYQSIFYGQAKHLRVGYLNRADALDLITRPSDDFSLEYSPELIDELIHLTGGQPYLLQHLCWELVNRWNERFLAEGEATPRQLTPADLEPVLTPDLYHAAGYYFDGVWHNITAAEQTLLRVMAPQPGRRWQPDDLATATGLTPAAMAETIELLLRHDVVTREGPAIHIASELMRRWIVYAQGQEGSDASSRESSGG